MTGYLTLSPRPYREALIDRLVERHGETVRPELVLVDTPLLETALDRDLRAEATRRTGS